MGRSGEVFLTNTSGRLIPVLSVLGLNEALPGAAGEHWKRYQCVFKEREDRDRASWEARKGALGVSPNAPGGLE